MKTMKSAVMALVVVGALAAIPAKASTFTFTDDHCTGGCLPLTDLITVTQNGANTVNISVTGTGWGFIGSGAGGGNSFFFNLVGNPTISVTGLTAGWNLVSTTAGSLAGDGYSGLWEYAVNCVGNTGGCSFGGSSPKSPPLSFNVVATGLTVSSFEAATGNIFFAADVKNLTNGNTGLVGASPSTSSVPEPISLSLVGGGLLALGIFRKRFVA